jgi:MATE family multidrug resistance protein
MKKKLSIFWRVYRRHFQETISLSIPVIIGQLGFVLMGVIDNMMIGQLTYVHLSAGALANGNFFIIAVLGMGISFAISPLVAEAAAKENHLQTAQYLKQGSWIGLLTGIVLGTLIWFSADLFPYMNQPEEDVVLADSYLRILSFTMMPLMIFLVFKQFVDGLSHTVPAMVITLLGLSFNVLANWLLIYGNWGFPRLELDGAGYGTLSSRIFMMVLMIAYVFRNQRFRIYDLGRGWWRWNLQIMRKILSIGVPSGFQYFFEVGAFTGAAIMVGWLVDGSLYRAAHQIVIQLASLTYMLVSGLAAGAAIRVGNSLGKKDRRQMRLAGMSGIYLGAAFMLLAALSFVVGRELLPALFVEDEKVLTVAANLMIIAAFFQLFDGIQAVGVSVLRGLQDVRIPTLVTFVVYWVISLPLGYVFGFILDWGVEGIWYSFVVSLLLASVVLTSRFWRMTASKAQPYQEAKMQFAQQEKK